MLKGDSVSLRHIIDRVSAVGGSLLSIGSEMDVMNAILVHMVLSKVDVGDASSRCYKFLEGYKISTCTSFTAIVVS